MPTYFQRCVQQMCCLWERVNVTTFLCRFINTYHNKSVQRNTCMHDSCFGLLAWRLTPFSTIFQTITVFTGLVLGKLPVLHVLVHLFWQQQVSKNANPTIQSAKMGDAHQMVNKWKRTGQTTPKWSLCVSLPRQVKQRSSTPQIFTYLFLSHFLLFILKLYFQIIPLLLKFPLFLHILPHFPFSLHPLQSILLRNLSFHSILVNITCMWL